MYILCVRIGSSHGFTIVIQDDVGLQVGGLNAHHHRTCVRTRIFVLVTEYTMAQAILSLFHMNVQTSAQTSNRDHKTQLLGIPMCRNVLCLTRLMSFRISA